MTATRINSDFRDVTNIVSATRKTSTVTTGVTGNIATGYANDGYTAIVAPYVAGRNVYLRAWVSAGNNGWYLTAIDPNTGNTVNNTQMDIRYWLVKFKNS